MSRHAQIYGDGVKMTRRTKIRIEFGKWDALAKSLNENNNFITHYSISNYGGAGCPPSCSIAESMH